MISTSAERAEPPRLLLPFHEPSKAFHGIFTQLPFPFLPGTKYQQLPAGSSSDKGWKDLEVLIWSLGDIFQKKQLIVELLQYQVVTYILEPGISTGLSFLHVAHGIVQF